MQSLHPPLPLLLVDGLQTMSMSETREYRKRERGKQDEDVKGQSQKRSRITFFETPLSSLSVLPITTNGLQIATKVKVDSNLIANCKIAFIHLQFATSPPGIANLCCHFHSSLSIAYSFFIHESIQRKRERSIKHFHS